MTTTSMKLPDKLKSRAVAAVKQQGVSTHAFMVDAIRKTVDASERRADFVAQAENARAEALGTGDGFAAEEVHDYIRQKIRGETAGRPKSQTWRE